MPEWLLSTIFTVTRWLHLMASTLIVGGTLFFEFVVPRAIDELKMETQLTIIGQLRYFFRRVVWGCVFLLPFSGAFSLYFLWPSYVTSDGQWSAAFPWGIAHMALGFVALGASAALVIGGSVPTKARQWLKINFLLLMAVMFIASASRHVRMYSRERILRQDLHPGQPPAPYVIP